MFLTEVINIIDIASHIEIRYFLYVLQKLHYIEVLNINITFLRYLFVSCITCFIELWEGCSCARQEGA
jgi:hypothetical protein